MTTKDTHVRVPVSVARLYAKVYAARLTGAGGAGLTAMGGTAKEATTALGAALAWTAHCEPCIALDGSGAPWLLYPWGAPGNWIARRPAERGGSTLFAAPTWSKARELIATWNAPREPEPRRCARCGATKTDADFVHRHDVCDACCAAATNTAATRIKAALAAVHAMERTSTNPDGYDRATAYAHVVDVHKLDADDAGILRRALSLD